ncbi:MAG: hypothetical protein IJL12_05095 [Selenomonadaceae bacterium]|nr:hypothetical protein [Selenomonadaceae bacterium]
MKTFLKKFYLRDIIFAAGSSMCRLLPRRKEVARMEIFDWIELICSVGTLIFAALTYFDNYK